MRLSLIITVYNKEFFLRKCIDSCLLQNDVSSNEYEIIIVNDGSTDNSSRIISEYEKINNVRIINQNNSGLSEARNNGVEICSGEYVWFIDADDSIRPNSVCTILEAIKTSPDVIPIYAETDGERKIRNQVPVDANNGYDVLISSKWEPCSPFYIIRRSFLSENGLKFFPGIYHEDNEFTPRMLYFAKSVIVINTTLYMVYFDSNSITHVNRPKRSYDGLIIAHNLNQFMNDHFMNNILQKVFNHSISVIINNAFANICYSTKNEINRFNTVVYSFRKDLAPLRKSRIKYRVEYCFFMMFPKHYVKVYKTMKFFDAKVLN